MKIIFAALLTCIVVGAVFLALGSHYYVKYLTVLEKEKNLPPGSSSPYLHTDLDYSIYAVLVGGIIASSSIFFLVRYMQRRLK